MIGSISKFYPGTLFLVVGNSGSGKDSIISGVVKRYPNGLNKIIQARRYITRSPSETENNYYINHAEFKIMENSCKFALKWHIYGLDYGVPIEIEDWLKNGHPVLVNVSRLVIEKAREKYENLKVVFIEVPFEITVKRIKSRGREGDNSLEERIERARIHQNFLDADFKIDNSGVLDDAVDQLLNYLLKVINQNDL